MCPDGPYPCRTAWFLVEAVVVVNVCLIMTGMVYVLHILPNTDIVLVFVISLLYGFTVVMFSFMATPFFSKSKVSACGQRTAMCAVRFPVDRMVL